MSVDTVVRSCWRQVPCPEKIRQKEEADNNNQDTQVLAMEVTPGPTGLMAADGSVASADRIDQLWEYIKALEDRMNETICLRADKMRMI